MKNYYGNKIEWEMLCNGRKGDIVQGKIKAYKSYVGLPFDPCLDDFDVLFDKGFCHCGCGYYQIFGFFRNETESTMIDLIIHDRSMWE